MRTSVAMTTYNGSAFISEQLESLCAQEIQPFELIIKDDCSSDDTLEKVEAFRSKAKFPIRIYKNPRNVGYRRNFMEAAALCKGDLIAFCDQDDIWASNKLAACAEGFSSNDVLMVYHNGSIVNKDGVRTGEMLFHNKKVHGSPWMFINGCTQVIRSSLLRYGQFWDQSIDTVEINEPMAHDLWFHFLSHSLGKVIYDDRDLIKYRRHDKNISERNLADASWRQRIGAAADRMVNIATAANNRHDLLDRLSSQVASASELTHAKKSYGVIARNYERRCLITQTDSLLARAALYFKIYAAKQPHNYEVGGLLKILFFDLMLLANGPKVARWAR